MKNTSFIILFDVDGTLTLSRQSISYKLKNLLTSISSTVNLAFVGGSDLPKQQEQLKETIDLFDYWFPQNGVMAYKNKKIIKEYNLVSTLGEDLYQSMINYILQLLSEITLPVKRGLFIELREAMVNVSPIGRSCTQKERDDFLLHDRKYRIRENMVDLLKKKYGKDNIHFSIGGQISIDIFPVGWDKTFCLQYLEEFDRIYFLGDMTHAGGNDHEIFNDNRIIGVSVDGPDKTYMEIVRILEEEGVEYDLKKIN